MGHLNVGNGVSCCWPFGCGQWRELLPVYACVDVGRGQWRELLPGYAHLDLGNGVSCCLCVHRWSWAMA